MTALTMVPVARMTPDYERLLRDLSDSDEERRNEGVVRLLVARAPRAKRLPQRNRMWADAVGLLLNGRPWSFDNDPGPLLDPTALSGIAESARRLTDPPPALAALTNEVLAESWATFDDFQRSKLGQQCFTDELENRVGKFQTWFNRYLPCVMMGLPANVELAQTVVAQRIEWMLDKLQPRSTHEDADEGLRESFATEAWAYARNRWAEAQSADSAAATQEQFAVA
jgi:hypothetical protein